MSSKPIRIPDDDHPIDIAPSGTHVVVRHAGRAIADTREALLLREASYPPVLYIPRRDADMDLLTRTDHATYCPYKGDAAYYSIAGTEGTASVNAVWTYEAPHPAVAGIRDHLAFYPDRVDSIVED